MLMKVEGGWVEAVPCVAAQHQEAGTQLGPRQVSSYARDADRGRQLLEGGTRQFWGRVSQGAR